MSGVLTLDGTTGEGGGQILRSSLGLSLVTGKPVHLVDIRGGRRKPGLLRQHLTAVRAAAEIGAAEVEGAELGSSELTFRPQTILAGDYHYTIGTAGSTTLVLQTVLPALLRAEGPSTVRVEGGTHNMAAPPYHFIERCFVPAIRRMGADVSIGIERHGFHPAGGGAITLHVNPGPLEPASWMERGETTSRRATALVSQIPDTVGHREVGVVSKMLHWARDELEVVEVSSPGPGNVLMLEVAWDGGAEMTIGYGERGRPAEAVARQAVQSMKRFLGRGVPVGEYLADQLLLPLALAGGGSFRTVGPSRHTTTNAEVIQRFLPVRVAMTDEGDRGWVIEVGSG